MKNIILLGSTGSIGVNTLRIVKNDSNKKVLGASSTGRNYKIFAKQIKDFKIPYIAISNYKYKRALINELNLLNIKVLPKIFMSSESLIESISEKMNVIVVNAIDGAAGLLSSISAINKGFTLALANKESLVIGGAYIKSIIKRDDQILPIDSEHSAIYQCLKGKKNSSAK
jgi:1-deoxy-D-xylulose-5-phosphate reductoisomerase